MARFVFTPTIARLLSTQETQKVTELELTRKLATAMPHGAWVKIYDNIAYLRVNLKILRVGLVSNYLHFLSSVYFRKDQK